MCRYQVPSSLLFAAGSTQLQLQEEQIAAAARRSYTCGAGAVQRLRSHADGRAAVRIDLLCRGREGQLGCGSDLRSSPVAWRSRRVHAHSSLFFYACFDAQPARFPGPRMRFRPRQQLRALLAAKTTHFFCSSRPLDTACTESSNSRTRAKSSSRKRQINQQKTAARAGCATSNCSVLSTTSNNRDVQLRVCCSGSELSTSSQGWAACTEKTNSGAPCDVLMNDAQLCHLFTLAAAAETPRERLLNQWHRAGDIPNYQGRAGVLE